eukprot:g3589.t1
MLLLLAVDAIQGGDNIWGIGTVEMLGNAMLAVLRDVAATLRIVHARAGIVHFDLKPENIIVVDAGGGNVRGLVADWGGAIQFNTLGRSQTRRGTGQPSMDFCGVQKNVLWYNMHVEKLRMDLRTRFDQHDRTPLWFLEAIEDGTKMDDMLSDYMWSPFTRNDAFALMMIAQTCWRQLERLTQVLRHLGGLTQDPLPSISQLKYFAKPLRIEERDLRDVRDEGRYKYWVCNLNYAREDIEGPDSAEDEDSTIEKMLQPGLGYLDVSWYREKRVGEPLSEQPAKKPRRRRRPL